MRALDSISGHQPLRWVRASDSPGAALYAPKVLFGGERESGATDRPPALERLVHRAAKNIGFDALYGLVFRIALARSVFAEKTSSF